MNGPSRLGWPRRVLASHPRFLLALAAGLVVFLVLPHRLRLSTRAIIGWDIGALALLILSAILFCREPVAGIRSNAEAQQEGEWTVFWITIAGAVASFAALIVEFSGGKDQSLTIRNLHVAIVAATLLLSWLVTQTLFALRYAHEYYERKPGTTEIAAGLQFPGEDNPDYWDFVYFAFVLGMTFQVSDVQITSRQFRRLATVHGLIGFLFNTVIIALTVNIAAGLL